MTILNQRYIKRLAILFGKDFRTSDGKIEPNFLSYFQDAAGIESNFEVYPQDDVNLSVGKAVVVKAPGKLELASNTDMSQINGIVGIIIPCEIDCQVRVRFMGKVTNEDWAWNIQQPIFLSNDGELTQAVPTTGFIKVIGNPTIGNSIWVNPETSIILV